MEAKDEREVAEDERDTDAKDIGLISTLPSSSSSSSSSGMGRGLVLMLLSDVDVIAV